MIPANDAVTIRGSVEGDGDQLERVHQKRSGLAGLNKADETPSMVQRARCRSNRGLATSCPLYT